jgi:galactokinase
VIDTGGVAERARMNGLTAGAADAVAGLAARCAAALQQAGVESAEGAQGWFVPGRVEVLGKHTDYAGGRSLLTTLERGFCMIGVPRGDGQIRMIDARSGESAAFPLSPELVVERGGWPVYPMTVARRFARNFPESGLGADIAFASNLPPAAGMSSSSAFLVATFKLLAALNGLPSTARYRHTFRTTEELADYLAAVENGSSYGALQGDRGVGTQSGSEDHIAILCGRPGELVQYRFAPVQFQRAIPFPRGYVLAFGATGVLAEKTGDALEKYNRLSRLARQVAELWNAGTGRSDPNMAAALASSPDALQRMRETIAAAPSPPEEPALLLDRLNQFAAESEEIIPAAGDALLAGQVGQFGMLVERSQEGAERLLRNQVPETEALVRSARSLGAAAASAFGAGFGGSVWALVRRDVADDFRAAWRAAYVEDFPTHADAAEFFLSAAGPPAQSILDPG